MEPGGWYGDYVRHSHRTSPPPAAHERRRPAADGGDAGAGDRRSQACRRRSRSGQRPDGARAPGRRPVFVGRHYRPDRERRRAAQRFPGPRHPRHRTGPHRHRRPGRARGAARRGRATLRRARRPNATRELANEYRAVIEAILEHRGARRIADALAERRRPRRSLPTPRPTRPTSRSSSASSCSRPSTSRRGSSWPSAGRARALADLELKEQDPPRSQRRHRQAASASCCCAARWTRSARSWARRRRRRRRRVPHALAELRAARRRCATRSTKEIDRLERTSEQSPEHGWIRTWLDAVFELPWGDAHRGVDSTSRDARARARCRPQRSRRREGAHPRVPGGAQAARTSAASASDSGRGLGRDPRARRSARRRQDVARRVGGARASAARSCASRSAACATRPRSAVTGVPTSVRARVASCAR